MRGGIFSPPPPVKVYLCYKGEQVPIIDLEDETIRNKNITQRQVAESISKIDPNSIIGILFRRTVYDWTFCVFEYEPEKQSVIQFDDNDILNAIRALTTDFNLEMAIPQRLAINGHSRNSYGLRMVLCSRKSRIPGSNNLVLIDKGLEKRASGNIVWKDRQELTVQKKETMIESPQSLYYKDINFLDLKKLPYDIHTTGIVNQQKAYCSKKVMYEPGTFDYATRVFDKLDDLCQIPNKIYYSVINLVKKSVTLLKGTDCAANDSNPIVSGISNNQHLSENRSQLKPSAPPFDPNKPFMLEDDRGSAPPFESQPLDSNSLESPPLKSQPLDSNSVVDFYHRSQWS
jgi:hypothetical protein